LRETQVLGKTVRYEYDAEGRRVKRENVGQGTTYYVYDGGGELAAEYGAMEMMSCARCYLTGDMLGSTRLVTDEVGAVKQRTDYLPFGESVSVSATQGGGRQTITDGGGQTTYMLGGGPTQKFTGKERDAETGLDYFGARYMSAAQGRFTSPDKPFADQFPEDPQSWNLYVYGRNNPLLYIDPTGERVEIHGSTEEERQRALAALTGSLSKEAQSRVSIGSEKDKQGNTHYFAQISGDVGDFMRLGGQDSLENKFANLVNDAKTTEFALTNVDLSSFGGGVTAFPGESLQGNWSSSSNTRILVNPNQLSIADTRLRKTVFGVMQFEGNKEGWDIRPMTLGIATWHEFGHAWGSMHGRTGSRSNLEALGWENSARERAYGPLGPKNARRRNHP
jgi:RHS repeat-associated protein